MSEIVNNITGHINVCTEVVGKNLCIGCGLCAAICPRENLKIEFNRFGEYNAFETGAALWLLISYGAAMGALHAGCYEPYQDQ